MTATNLLGRKISAKVNSRFRPYIVKEFDTDGMPYFTLIDLINGKVRRVPVSKLNSWSFIDTFAESEARKSNDLIVQLHHDGIEKESPVFVAAIDRFREARNVLFKERSFRYELEQGLFLTYIDVKDGNMISRELSIEEVDKAKQYFLKEDKTITGIQMYNKFGELVVEEWECSPLI